eukprot:424701_1
MSTRQKASKLLTFGYVNENYADTVPLQLLRLMQLFYDEWYYWVLKGKKLKEFISSKNGEIKLYPKLLNIEGVEFEIIACPNGVDNKARGFVQIGFGIKHLPLNIDYIECYQQIECESLNYSIKSLCKAASKKRFRGNIFPLSELNLITNICFNCKINIKYIKYNKLIDIKNNKIDYYSQINQMNKYAKFRWNINNIFMQKCNNMKHRQRIQSDNFDTNNWCLQMYPHGCDHQCLTVGEVPIYLRCLSLPYTIKSMDVKFTFTAEGQSFKVTEVRRRNFAYVNPVHGVYMMSFDDFKDSKSFSVDVTLEITNIYNENDKIINQNEWKTHKIIINDINAN